MGASNSVEESPVFQSFISSFRTKGPLSLEELWGVQLPKFVREIDLFNPAVLFQIDSDRDGLFSVDDMTEFGELVNKECSVSLVSEHQIGERINGLCVYNFSKNLSNDVSEWMIRMLCFEEKNQPTVVSRDALIVLHKLMCRGSGKTDLSFYEFYSILKQCENPDAPHPREEESVQRHVVESLVVSRMMDHYGSLLRKALES